MTAVPPPVPPEIVEKATHALKAALWGPYGVQPPDSYVAAAVIAAVYGDIVEAARRDALESAARVIGDEAAADGVYGTDIQSGLLRAGRIVWTMARDGLSATVSDQQPESGSTPVRDSEGPQIAAEGRPNRSRGSGRCATPKNARPTDDRRACGADR